MMRREAMVGRNEANDATRWGVKVGAGEGPKGF
jgi:hypothetical protein